VVVHFFRGAKPEAERGEFEKAAAAPGWDIDQHAAATLQNPATFTQYLLRVFEVFQTEYQEEQVDGFRRQIPQGLRNERFSATIRADRARRDSNARRRHMSGALFEIKRTQQAGVVTEPRSRT